MRVWVVLLAVVVCACGGDDDGGSCVTSADCPAGLTCVDQRCVTGTDGGLDSGNDSGEMCTEERSCRGGSLCCNEGEECVDGIYCFPICENTRCGDDGAVCCAAGETCLDGVVCAADCDATQALCGVDLELCCDAGDACVADACVTPGIECGDDFDCRDSALYCEPTIGRCLPTPEGPTCEVRPEFEDVRLVEEWHWEGVMVGGSLYSEVITTPMTGDVSGDGIPDVVIPAYTGTAWNDPVLVAIHGATGETLWVIDRSVAATAPEGEGTAVANFDPSDDALEVAYRLDSGGFRLMDGDGTTELAFRVGPNERGTIEVADLNADGTPDIILGCRAYNGLDPSAPAMDLFDRGSCLAGSYGSPSIADLDGDGRPDVTSGSIAVDPDGTIIWDNSRPHALTAVADLDLDGNPEVVTVIGGSLDILDGGTGTRWGGLTGALAIPGGGVGGAPTVADFDADGLPEIAAAGQAFYTVYDPDCFATPARAGGTCGTASTNGILWSTATQDLSSSVTGSSVFDFQGDGVAEVIYNDECFLHVYDGETGRELLMEPIPNSSRTGFEYPTVVDVDGDGNSEIVVVANRDQAVIRDDCPAAYSAAFGVPVGSLPAEIRSGTTGVFAYGDPDDRWVGTRPIWNQYSYHVSNVEADGTIPTTEIDNWTTPGLNNYRQNVQGTGIFNAPNLQVELTAVSACGTNEFRLSAVVRNAGSRGVAAGITIDFVRTDTDPEETLASAVTTGALLPGGTERITVLVPVPADTDLTFEARVDGVESVVECVEDDNTDEANGRCSSIL